MHLLQIARAWSMGIQREDTPILRVPSGITNFHWITGRGNEAQFPSFQIEYAVHVDCHRQRCSRREFHDSLQTNLKEHSLLRFLDLHRNSPFLVTSSVARAHKVEPRDAALVDP